MSQHEALPPDSAAEPAVVLEEVEHGIALLKLNRPSTLNAMNRQLIEQLHAHIDAVDQREDLRVLILTGAGRGFCSGLDLADPTLLERPQLNRPQPDGPQPDGPQPDGPQPDGTAAQPAPPTRGRPQAGMALQQEIAELIPKLRSLRIPVIAAVNGPATGGGLALVCGADLRIASQSAKFGVAFIRIGLSACDIGVSWILPRLVGAARAQELMLTGRIFDAEEAERIGLVTQVVPDNELLDSALQLARQVAANSPFGVWMTKEVMWSNLETGSQRAAIDLENRTQILSSFTEDMGEAVVAFLGKRAPKFRNR